VDAVTVAVDGRDCVVTFARVGATTWTAPNDGNAVAVLLVAGRAAEAVVAMTELEEAVAPAGSVSS
jgi:hypothetical protein